MATYPLVIGGVSLIASIIGTYAVRSEAGNVERALYQGLIVRAAWRRSRSCRSRSPWSATSPSRTTCPALLRGGSDEAPSGIEFYLCTLVGIAVTAGLFVITDYYTSTRFRPVRTTARASETGHATNIIQGLAQGLQSTAAPAILLALGILVANEFAGIYGIGVAVMAQLSLTGLDRGARRLRADHGQRGRHRRDGRPAGGCAQRDRPARRGRQHHQGRHQGLRDRLGRAGRPGAVRGVRRGATRGGGGQGPAVTTFNISQPEAPIGL